MTVQIAAYSNPFRLNFRLGVTVFFKSPFRSVGMIVLLSAMFVLQYIPVYLCKLIARMLLPWLTGITILIWMLFVFNRMDRYIHPVYYPELVGKGILAREFAPREEQADQTTQKIETK